MRSINRRLQHLESLFQRAHPQLVHQNQLGPLEAHSPGSASLSGASMHASPAAAALSGSASSYRPPKPEPQNGHHLSLPHANQAVEPREQSASDTEDAVADLEEQTFGARVPVLRALHAAAQAPVRSYKYVKVPDMELTRCMTSILAEPLSFDQDGRPRSAVRLGLDLAVSTVDLPAVRDEALAQVVAVLPDAEIASFLIEKYFSEVEFDFRVLDPVAFRVEHERFVQMVQQGRQALVDPLWIGVFAMVLTLALEAFWSRPNGMKNWGLFRGLAEADLRDLPSVWHDAALRALQLGEYGGTPRIRTIQCVILFGQCECSSRPRACLGGLLLAHARSCYYRHPDLELFRPARSLPRLGRLGDPSRAAHVAPSTRQRPADHAARRSGVATRSKQSEAPDGDPTVASSRQHRRVAVGFARIPVLCELGVCNERLARR